MAEAQTSKLADIKQRLRTGKLSEDDIRQLEAVVQDVERAAKALRAAIIE